MKGKGKKKRVGGACRGSPLPVSFCSKTADVAMVGDETPVDEVAPASKTTSSEETATWNRDPTTDEAQALVIASLRTQVSDLISQVSQLNNKLVQSYDRVSILEDNIHISSSNIRSSSLRISQLELERTQHLAALNTGLLVEKDHVTTELTRLMERATEEAARRGQAESARAEIEKDLDDLSANLFGQANSMVAEARFQKSLSDRKLEDAESALKSTEEVISGMQQQMQHLREEKEKSDEEAFRTRALMGKGKFVEHGHDGSPTTIRLLSLHTPYQEFLLFVAHLRSIRPSSPQPPVISTLLPLPFLARLSCEDSDATVRLDFAPSLNWLSRRAVATAIYSGQLTIEPVSSSSLLTEPPSSTLALPTFNPNIVCALCGSHILTAPSTPAPSGPLSTSLLRQNSVPSWSTSLFKAPRGLSSNISSNPSPPLTPPPTNSQLSSQLQPQHVYVFHVAQSTSGPQQNVSRPTNYPLCTSGWCLSRLRSACSLWAFVRSGIVDKIWEEEVAVIHSPTPQKGEAPPLPPRRKSKMSVGNLWGMASVALSKKGDSTPEKRPSLTSMHTDPLPSLPPRKAGDVIEPGTPPPLPRRNMDRGARKAVPELSAADIVQEEKPPVPLDTAAPAPAPDVPVEKEEIKEVEDEKKVVGELNGVDHQSDSEDNSKGLSTPRPKPKPLTAPPLSRSPPSTATDVFATPTEEMDPNTEFQFKERPMSPSKVPLPESSPATPITNVFPRSAVANTPTKALQSDEAKGPSRTGSPAPPPLPRRAAARRPVPALPLSLVPAGESTEATSQPKVDGTGVQSTNTEPVEPRAATPPPAKPPTPQPVQPEPEPEKLGPSLMRRSIERNGTEQVVPVAPALEKVDISTDTIRASIESSSVDSPTTTSSFPDDIVPGSFVGESTWEERTWKEVVRLREQMFWARIGAVRL